MADKRCENGHFIDDSWDLCPYCPSESASEDEAPPAVHPRPRHDDGPVAAPDPYPSGTRGGVDQAPSQPRRPQRTVTVAKLEQEAEQAPRFVIGWLIGLNGSSRGESYTIRSGRNVLGRSRSCDIWVHDEQASAHHADLVYRPEEKRYILMDHNSTNGTYVNGVEIEPRRDLVSRDIVTIGSHRLLFVALSDFGLDWDDQGELR